MKRARLTAGWLKQKPTSIALLLVMLTSAFGVLIFIPSHASAAQTATWKDDSTINYNGVDYSSHGNGTLAYNTNPGKTYQIYSSPLPAGGCLSEIFFDQGVDVSTATSAHYMAGVMGNGPSGSTGVCIGQTGSDVSFTNTQANNNSADGGQVATEDPCDGSGDPLSWFICPVINMINGAITKMQAIIDNLLEFDVATVFDRSKASGQAYYTAWNSFRLVGIAVVVIAGLVMVITQALGLEVFDAYTVKKVVPRLFLAAIGISLSWYLLQFLANFTNDVGLAVRNMIYWPFRNIGNGDTGLTSASGFLAGDLLVGGILFTLGIAGTLSLVVTAGLAALVAFLVLILRQLVLILLILLAPLAIALYILPNTQKVYHLWWDSISKGFMMFPIITAFIATGRVFSVVAANAGGSGIHHTVNEVISLIAFFLPYFALPFTFRLAGGALGTLAGLTNDRSRGAFDRLKNFRANQAAQGWERKKNANLFRGGTENNWRGRINRGVANTIATPGAISESGTTINPTKWRASVQSARSTREFDHAMEGLEKNTAMRAIAADDTLLQAGLAGDESAVRNYLQKSGQTGRQLSQNTAAVMAAKRSMGDGAFNIAAGVALPGTKTAFAGEYDAVKNPQGLSANEQMAATISEVANGDKALAARMYGAARGQAGRAGRIDLAGHGFGAGITEIYSKMDGGAVDNDALNIDTFLNNDAVTIGRSDSRAVRNVMSSVQRQIEQLDTKRRNNVITNDEQVMLGRLTAGLENMRDQGFYFAPQRIESVVNVMDQTEAARQSVRNAVEDQNADPTIYNVGTRQRVRRSGQVEGYNEQRPDGPGGRRGTSLSPDDPRLNRPERDEQPPK